MSENTSALAPGTLIAGEFRIVSVLGSGGFGITYLADDLALTRRVAIKEYFPLDFATRVDADDVKSKSKGCSEDYHWGLERFIAEAQTLARFNHQNIVRVYRYIEANNTAYMVLNFEQGTSFKSWLMGLGRAPRQSELDVMLAPLLDALEMIHRHGLLHRDIAPDNIIIRADGTPVLIDFGSARGEIAYHSKTVSAIVKPGYSPFEQYAVTSRNQGAWTDIYSLAATLYHAVTGERPTDAPTRVVQDELQSAVGRARAPYRELFLKAIDAGLNVATEDRPQSVAAWRESLLAGSDALVAQARGMSVGAEAVQPAAPIFEPGETRHVQKSAKFALPKFARKTQRAARAKRMVDQPPVQPEPAPRHRAPAPAQPAVGAVIDAKPVKTSDRAGALTRLKAVFRRKPVAKAETPDVSASAEAQFLSSPTVKTSPNSVELLAARDPLAHSPEAPKAKGRLMDLLAEAQPEPTSHAAAPVGKPQERASAPRKLPQLPSLPRISVSAAVRPLKAAVAPVGEAIARIKQKREQALAREEIMRVANQPATGSAAPETPARKPVKLPAIRLPKIPKVSLPTLALPRVPRPRLPRPTLRSMLAPAALVIFAVTLATGFVLYEDRLRPLAPKMGGTAWTTKVNRAKPPQPQSFSAHEGQVTALAISDDGRHLISGGADRRLRVWNAYNGALLRTLTTHAASINALATEANRVVSADASGTVLVWNLDTGDTVHRVKHHDGLVWSVAFAPDGRGFASAGQDGTIKVWGGDGSGEPSSTLDHSGAVLALAYLDRNGRLLSAGADRRVRMWEPGREKVVRTYRGHADQVAALAVTPDQKKFASGGFDKQVRVWSTRSRKLLKTLRGHEGRITAMMFTPDGRYLLTGSSDQTVKIWSMNRRRALATLSGLETSVSTLAVTPDGRAVVAGGENGTIRIWPIAAQRRRSSDAEGTAAAAPTVASRVAETAPPPRKVRQSNPVREARRSNKNSTRRRSQNSSDPFRQIQRQISSVMRQVGLR